MLEQENSPSDSTILEEKSWIIEFEESFIDYNEPLYLITWAPDPKEMPDCDFNMQHELNVQTLADFLKTCKCGLFCVESTSLGNPHYHGWYQSDCSKELLRIVMVKTLKRFGLLKITEGFSFKINCYTERKNCLYYYKKDVFDEMLMIEVNPITKESRSTINFDVLDYVGFFSKDKNAMNTLKDAQSSRAFYREFYKDSTCK